MTRSRSQLWRACWTGLATHLPLVRSEGVEADLRATLPGILRAAPLTAQELDLTHQLDFIKDWHTPSPGPSLRTLKTSN